MDNKSKNSGINITKLYFIYKLKLKGNKMKKLLLLIVVLASFGCNSTKTPDDKISDSKKFAISGEYVLKKGTGNEFNPIGKILFNGDIAELSYTEEAEAFSEYGDVGAWAYKYEIQGNKLYIDLQNSTAKMLPRIIFLIENENALVLEQGKSKGTYIKQN
jgi:hypothetical protein